MLAPLVHALAAASLAVLIYVLALFVVALIRRDYSVIDRGWGIGILLAVLAALVTLRSVQLRQFVVALLVATWALRLGAHIIIRSWGRGEDWRYAQWRSRAGEYGWFFAFFRIFVLQGFLMVVIALPAILINSYAGRSWNWLDTAGVAVWLIGFIFESVADHQLTVFKHTAAGGVMKTGLWRYSRHPNYFGEAVQWWGLWLVALSVPLGWLSVFGPLTITFLLLKVSGVPILEEKQRQNPEYREYARRTSVFLPRPPGK